MTQPVILLADNGSKSPEATLRLRAIATSLGEACGQPIEPVSLRYADQIPAEDLDGYPAQVLVEFLTAHLAAGRREFILVPLLFGKSRALTNFVPEQVALLEARFGPFELRQAEVLSPLPEGEPLLADILADQVARCSRELGAEPTCVIVVDHGSPLPAVTAVRAAATMALRERIDRDVQLTQAVMERREGAEYDFNGQLLGDLLDAYAARDEATVIVLAMMFISPGRHAGPGGDIEQICRAARERNPGLKLGVSGLVGEHPLLIEILRQRLCRVLEQG